MSTQDDSGISFQISNEQQNFRLLELPPPLLGLIASRDPSKYVPTLGVCGITEEISTDTYESLWLKSAEPSNAGDDLMEPSPGAVLCTDDHTYHLRQVQSSNSIFILQPAESSRGDNEIPFPALSAIAQCTATLELIPSDTAANLTLLSRLMKKSLSLYNGTDTDVGLETSTTNPRRYKDKNAILQHAPFSTEEFNKTWKQLCVFETHGHAWLPTPSALAMVWKSILSVATVRGINLEKAFDIKSLAETVGNDGYPWALVMAVMIRLVSDTDHLRNDCVILSRNQTVQWVGMLCLQKAGESEKANSAGIPQSGFLRQWRDLLPGGWRMHASMDLLKVKFSHSDPSKERTVLGEDIDDPTSLEALPSANTGGNANRKWHEKFKMGRK